jgi:hypothetical protein
VEALLLPIKKAVVDAKKEEALKSPQYFLLNFSSTLESACNDASAPETDSCLIRTFSNSFLFCSSW